MRFLFLSADKICSIKTEKILRNSLLFDLFYAIIDNNEEEIQHLRKISTY